MSVRIVTSRSGDDQLAVVHSVGAHLTRWRASAVSVRSLPSPVPQVVNGRVARPLTAPESGTLEIQVGDSLTDRVLVRTAPGTPALPR